MCKYFYWIFIFAGLCCTAQFDYGFKAGITLPAMLAYGSDPFTNQEIRYADYDYKYNFQPFYISAFGSYKIKGQSNLHLDVYYTNTGLAVQKRVTYAGLINTPTNIKINSPALVVDALYKHNFLNGKLNALVGPYFAVTFISSMSSSTRLLYPEWGIDLTVAQQAKLQPYDLGVVLGGEYFLNSHLFLEARMNFGILNMIIDQTIIKTSKADYERASAAFVKATLDGLIKPEDGGRLEKLQATTDENGRHLSGVNMYKLFGHVGVGWRL